MMSGKKGEQSKPTEEGIEKTTTTSGRHRPPAWESGYMSNCDESVLVVRTLTGARADRHEDTTAADGDFDEHETIDQVA
jgi:hypothetical protein